MVSKGCSDPVRGIAEDGYDTQIKSTVYCPILLLYWETQQALFILEDIITYDLDNQGSYEMIYSKTSPCLESCGEVGVKLGVGAHH